MFRGRGDLYNACDSPVADCSVVTSAENMTSLERTPTESVSAITRGAGYTKSGSYSVEREIPHPPLFLLSFQLDIGTANSIRTRFARMLRPIEDVNVPADGFSGYKVGILRHISRPVDLDLMVDTLNDSHTSRRKGVIISKFYEPEADSAEVELLDRP